MKIEQIKEMAALNSKLEELNEAYCNPDNEFSIYVSRRTPDPNTTTSIDLSLRSSIVLDGEYYRTTNRTIYRGPEVKNFLYTLIQQIEQKLRGLGAIL